MNDSSVVKVFEVIKGGVSVGVGIILHWGVYRGVGAWNVSAYGLTFGIMMYIIQVLMMDSLKLWDHL